MKPIGQVAPGANLYINNAQDAVAVPSELANVIPGFKWVFTGFPHKNETSTDKLT